MTAVSRLQLLPPPGKVPGVPAAPGQDEQQVAPVVPARTVQGGQPDYRQADDADQRGGDRRVGDRGLTDRNSDRGSIGGGPDPQVAAHPDPAAGRLIAFSRLSSMPFMVQILGQETAGRPANTGPQTSLSGHRDAALLGSNIYRRAGGEPEFLPETATFVRLAV